MSATADQHGPGRTRRERRVRERLVLADQSWRFEPAQDVDRAAIDRSERRRPRAAAEIGRLTRSALFAWFEADDSIYFEARGLSTNINSERIS